MCASARSCAAGRLSLSGLRRAAGSFRSGWPPMSAAGGWFGRPLQGESPINARSGDRWARALTQDPVVRLFVGRVAVAGGCFEAPSVENGELSAAVLDQLALAQR